MKVILTSALLIFALRIYAQPEPEERSIHEMESKFYRGKINEILGERFDSYNLPLIKRNYQLSKKVIGYHPYWAPYDAYKSYDYSTLYAICYFSYEVDTATGGYISVHGWNTTPIINYAHQRGVKVMLTVTNFGLSENDAILNDTMKQDNLIDNLIKLLKQRNGDGVNIDFERISGDQRGNLVKFMKRLAERIRSEIPEAEISMAIPAVDWRNAFDLEKLSQICDYLILMGYGYHWSGSQHAGPVAPLEGENYNVTRSVNTYLNVGVTPEKLILGVPWYGYDWPVKDSTRGSQTISSGKPVYYKDAEPMAQIYGKFFDQMTKVPWFRYKSNSQWHQVWYDDSMSLSLKYQLVKSKNLGGIGIWALSYDGGRREIWEGIKQAFLQTHISRMKSLPSSFKLEQNYPNPFNNSTVIEYHLPENSHVKITLYDVLGRVVKVLLDERKNPGWHRLYFSADGLPSGVYFYKLQADNFTDVKKMVIVR
jgi:spore germination protein YaaH